MLLNTSTSAHILCFRPSLITHTEWDWLTPALTDISGASWVVCWGCSTCWLPSSTLSLIVMMNGTCMSRWVVWDSELPNSPSGCGDWQGENTSRAQVWVMGEALLNVRLAGKCLNRAEIKKESRHSDRHCPKQLMTSHGRLLSPVLHYRHLSHPYPPLLFCVTVPFKRWGGGEWDKQHP